MGFIYTALIGLVVGAIAKLLMPGRQGGGIIMTAILGVIGAFVATWGGQAMGIYKAGEGAGLLASIVGALVVLFIYGLVTKKS
jgi:uncharacterized membrane protein YeaQ/YmgE (transglycosylase-associated protein family)